MSEQFEARLIECLDALDQNQSIDVLLTQYPEDAADLRRALTVAGALPSLAYEPDSAAQVASRSAFLAQAEALSKKQTRPAAGGLFFARAGIMLAVVLAAGAIPVAASENALPGDALYGVKREVESVRLQIAPNDAARKALSDDYNQRRVREIEDLLRSGRYAETSFVGRLEDSSPDELKVDGLAIAIPPGFDLPTLPPVGSLVEVTVRAQDGQLTLVSVAPVPGGEAAPTQAPTVTPEPSVTPIPTPLPSPTLVPEDTHQPEVEPTETEDGEGEIEPTEDGEIEPTEDETEDGGDDGGGDDDGGDDDGGDDNSGSGGGDDGSSGKGGGGDDD